MKTNIYNVNPLVLNENNYIKKSPRLDVKRHVSSVGGAYKYVCVCVCVCFAFYMCGYCDK